MKCRDCYLRYDCDEQTEWICKSNNYCKFISDESQRVSDMEKRTILVKPSWFIPEFEMIIPIPEDRDAEEYIDALLEAVLSDESHYNVEWYFVDGIS